jgi:hypothetical protein
MHEVWGARSPPVKPNHPVVILFCHGHRLLTFTSWDGMGFPGRFGLDMGIHGKASLNDYWRLYMAAYDLSLTIFGAHP